MEILERRTIRLTAEELSKVFGVGVVRVIDAKAYGPQGMDGLTIECEIQRPMVLNVGKPKPLTS